MQEDPYGETCSVCVGHIGQDSLVEIAGEVDIASVTLLARAMNDAMRSGSGDVILDAQNLTYIDSAGLQTLISVQRRLESESRRIAVVGCHGIFHKLMKITHLEQNFPIFSTVDEALASLSGDAR